MKLGSLLSLLISLAAGQAAFAGSASAQSCAADADCKGGLVCTDAHYCALPDCAADSDCPDGTVCQAQTRCDGGAAPGTSSGGAPSSGGFAGAGEAPTPSVGDAGIPKGDLPMDEKPVEGGGECQEVKQCTPKYLLPCKEAADCGAGFTCEQTLMCSGGGGTVSVDAGAAMSGGGSAGAGGEVPMPGDEPEPRDEMLPEGDEMTPPPPDADKPSMEEPTDRPEDSCNEPTGIFHCEVIQMECESDADCVAGFTCAEAFDAPVGTACSGSGSSSGGADPGTDPGARDAGAAPGSGSGDDALPPGEEPMEPSDMPSVDDCNSMEPVAPAKRYCVPPFDFAADGAGTPQAASDGKGGSAESDGDDASGNGPDGGMSADKEEEPLICSVAAPGAGRGSSAAAMLLLGVVGVFMARKRRAR